MLSTRRKRKIFTLVSSPSIPPTDRQAIYGVFCILVGQSNDIGDIGATQNHKRLSSFALDLARAFTHNC